MKIAVIGAGIIGVTTAYELACDGHEVTVYERQMAVAEGASFANAGVLAPAYVTPWAAPGMPSKIILHLLARHSPVRFSWPLRPSELAWMWKSLRACNKDAYAQNRRRMQTLAFYSLACLHRVLDREKIELERAQGYTVLLRSERDRARIEASLQVLKDNGIAFNELSPQALRQIEPALNSETRLFQAIHLPDAEVANCRQYALLLKNIAQNMGVRFAFSAKVSALSASPAVSLAGSDTPQPIAYDHVVVCAGAESGRLLRPLGLSLPIASVHGYSISANIREAMDAPLGALMDERYKVAISRLGNRIRVAGGAELGGSPERHRLDAIATLYKVLQDWFPGAPLFSQGVQVWKGARPMLPDGPPLLGPSGIPGIWLNLGHGSSGWALSSGSARALADLIVGNKPEIDLAGLGLDRLRS